MIAREYDCPDGRASLDCGEELPLRDGAQSIRRSLKILQILAGAPASGLALGEIARLTDLAPSTTHRILKVLVELGAAEQRRRNRRYLIGSQLPLWAAARPAHLRLIDVTKPFLQRGSQKIGRVAFLSYRTHLDATCIARMADGGIGVPLVQIGSRRPLGMPVCSLAMLAELDEDEADALILCNCDRLSLHEIDLAVTRRQLRETRRRSFALRERGRVTGLTTVSLAIKPNHSRQLAAITVANPPERSSRQWIDLAARFLQECRDSLNSGVA